MKPKRNGKRELTKTQLRVLEAVAEGYTNKTGAEHLGMAPQTWRVHTQAIHTRLQVHTNAAAVSKGYLYGLLRKTGPVAHEERVG